MWQGLRMNRMMYETSKGSLEEMAFINEIANMDNGIARIMDTVVFPVVIYGGKLLVMGLDRLMALHISEELVPILKGVGALWLYFTSSFYLFFLFYLIFKNCFFLVLFFRKWNFRGFILSGFWINLKGFLMKLKIKKNECWRGRWMLMEFVYNWVIA